MQSDRSDSEARDIKNGKTQKPPHPDFRLSDLPGTAALVVLIFVIGASAFAYHFVNERSAKITFVTGATFSFVGLLVIIAQTIIYVQQAGFMKQQGQAMKDSVERTDTIIEQMRLQVGEMRDENASLLETLKLDRAKTDPRLRVVGVTAEKFQIGERPIYIVTIANDGLLPATDVRTHMSVEINDEKPMDWIDDVVTTIPANGKEHYFIHSSFWLSQEQLENFDYDRASLRVVGFFEYGQSGSTPFCYKYLSMQGESRPAKIPQFVRCDYAPRLNTMVIPHPAVHLHAAANIMIHGEVIPAKKEDKPDVDGEDKGQNPN